MQAINIERVIAVVGAGAMGAGIAQVALLAGHPVRLYDNRPGAAADACQGIAAQLQRLVDKGRLEASVRELALTRLHPAEALADLADAGLVIEAIVENLGIKQSLLRELEAVCAADCLLASNTSSLSITALAAGMKYPGRVLGMHFFNPAPLMALVEIVSGLASDKALAAQLYATAAAWGKKPVHAQSTPGFIVNRVARPYYAENLRLLQEGAADCATLDALMREAGGFPMGAFELTDLIGHDVNYAVTCSVFDAYHGDPRFTPSLIQKSLVDAGHLGRKSGRGFYDYQAGSERPQPHALTSSARPDTCVAEGDLGPLAGLLPRLREQGVTVIERDGPGLLRVGDAAVALSDGRMACQRAREEGLRELVLVDLALDYAKATRLAISRSADTRPATLDQVIGLLQGCGIVPSLLADVPGLAVLRTVAMLANEAADAVLHGVASPADVDLAMRAGTNYPKGPLAWADALGPARVLKTLQHLSASYGEDRYRPSLLLRRVTEQGGHLHDQSR